MSERAISDPTEHGWVDAGDGKWMWGGSGGGSGNGSIQDGDTEGQITTWDGTEWTPTDDMHVTSGIMKLYDRGSGDGEVRIYHEDDNTDFVVRGSAGSVGTFSISASDGDTAATRMTIDADGNVNITGKLFVNGEEVGGGGASYTAGNGITIDGDTIKMSGNYSGTFTANTVVGSG